MLCLMVFDHSIQTASCVGMLTCYIGLITHELLMNLKNNQALLVYLATFVLYYVVPQTYDHTVQQCIMCGS